MMMTMIVMGKGVVVAKHNGPEYGVAAVIMCRQRSQARGSNSRQPYISLSSINNNNRPHAQHHRDSHRVHVVQVDGFRSRMDEMIQQGMPNCRFDSKVPPPSAI
jgi:hypothetical protein